MEKQNEMYLFINKLWQFIKHTEIPKQDDHDAWDKIVETTDSITRNYWTSDPLHRLFRAWMVATLEYMSDLSIAASENKTGGK